MRDTLPNDAALQQPDATAISAAVAPDDVYALALEDLLIHAVRPPGVLHRLRQAIWLSLVNIHRRQNEDVGRLPPEYWFWPS